MNTVTKRHRITNGVINILTTSLLITSLHADHDGNAMAIANKMHRKETKKPYWRKNQRW